MKRIKKCRRCWPVMICMICTVCSMWMLSAQADVSGDLHDFFDGLGYTSNLSGPSAYQGQSAGYYTGGSFSLRGRVRNAQLVSMSAPNVSMGCGGIDVHLGGFSFINGQGITDLMQSILHGATGYIAELALEQALPMATNVMRHMQDAAREANKLNINSCHAAAQLVGALGLQRQESQQQVCASAAVSMGVVSGWGEAVTYCQNPAQYDQVMQRAGQPGSPYEASVAENVNVAWKALQHQSFLSSDRERAELLMALSGTIIMTHDITKDPPVQKVQYIPSQASDASLIHALLQGGTAPFYRCDTTDACLHPTLGTVVVRPEAALKSHVSTLLQSMLSKIALDQPLDPTERAFLQATRLPLYKMLNVQSAYGGGSGVLSVIDVESYSDLLASDLLSHYLEESLHAVEAGSRELQYPPSVMKPFLSGIQQALTAVRQQGVQSYQRIALESSMIERTQAAEKMLASSLASSVYGDLNLGGRGS